MEGKERMEERRQKVLDYINQPMYKPMTKKQLAQILTVPKEDFAVLDGLLSELRGEGAIDIENKRIVPGKVRYVPGTFCGTARGFGFVTPEDGADDIFIPAEGVGKALHGDQVLCQVLQRAEGDRKASGQIVSVTKHGTDILVGTLINKKKAAYVRSDEARFDRTVKIGLKQAKEYKDGHKVVVKIISWPEDKEGLRGKIVEDLGHRNQPTAQIQSVIYRLGVPGEFPDAVFRSLEAIEDRVSEEMLEGREDLRRWRMVTIDGEDAKDLDDAVSIRRCEHGYELGVHIADVSHYVPENSPLDREAYSRGTSVYLTDRVIPMLPPKLSNGICSLNAGKDRLALSCIMELNEEGQIVSHRIVESAICVARRMSYTQVSQILSALKLLESERSPEQKALLAEHQEFLGDFAAMEELARKRIQIRDDRGAIDFDFPECKITTDDEGNPVEIQPYERNIATRIIEEFMLLANETVAQEYYWRDVPFVYRTHEKPDPEKIRTLNTFVYNMGHRIKGSKGGDVHPKALQALLEELEGKPEEGILARLTLRSMKQAKYTVNMETGHFGLAARYYCHFTSPIRRYPDLMIHRIIKHTLHHGYEDAWLEKTGKTLAKTAEQCSATERRAQEAERDVDRYMKALYMKNRYKKDHGKTRFDGVISGVIAKGIFVELENTVEGFIPVEDLTLDYFIFDRDRYRLEGEHTHRVYALGQKIQVYYNGSDMDTYTVYFLEAGEIENGQGIDQTDCTE